jgi:hypothetical protein
MTTIKRAVWLLAMVVGITIFVRAAPEKKKTSPDAKPSNVFQLTVQEPASAIVPDDFTLVVLPDAQFYTANKNGGKSEMLVAQTEWIVSNRVSRNIAFVTTEGDISNDGGKINAQWERATNALYRLENPARTGLPDGIPYSAVVGNHDAHYGGTAKFNEYFGTSHFAGRRYYGGHCSIPNHGQSRPLGQKKDLRSSSRLPTTQTCFSCFATTGTAKAGDTNQSATGAGWMWF